MVLKYDINLLITYYFKISLRKIKFMTTKLYSLQISKFALILIILMFSEQISAQTVPENTRLFQLNTKKGSRLNLVESTDSNVYHAGTINNSEVGFDGLTATNVGVDDLFILKSTANNGNNVWFKTFNAGWGGKISPKNIFIDKNDNIYVFAQFQGSVRVGSKTVTSSNATDAFLLKLDSNGNAKWISYLPEGNSVSSGGYVTKTKCVTDGSDTFFVYHGNHLLRLNDADGEVIYDNIYNNVELKSVALNGQNLYLAGATTAEGVNFGNEFINQNYVGFIVKGDKNANFTASTRTSQNISFQSFSDISDIAVSGDGALILSGFYTRNAINLITETGTSSFTYNPNPDYNNVNLLYNYIAKVDLNLATVSFFRSSGGINKESVYAVRTDLTSSKLIPYDNSGDFKQINYITNRSGSSLTTTYTNPNGTSTVLAASLDPLTYTALLSYNAQGGYSSGSQLTSVGFKMSASSTGYTTTENSNIRLFTTSVYNAENASLLWSKQKTNSIGGSISKQFQKHLMSAKSDIFFTALAEGKGQFFNTPFDNGQNIFSRYIKRLGPDGTVKWKAVFDNTSNKDELNISQDFACSDKDDNFYFVAGIKGNAAVFSDALGTSVNFSNATGNSKALVKLDQNGKMLWHKQLDFSAASKVAVTTDSAGNIYLLGQADGSFTVDSFSIPADGDTAVFVVKFASSGSIIYSKYYKKIGVFSFNPVFDSQDNLYAFVEPKSISSGSEFPNYIFGNLTIPSSINGADHLMLKFDNAGNVIFGKNFYANSSDDNYAYSWPNDVVFDGTDFIISGNYYGDSDVTRYVGLDGVTIPRTYPGSYSYVPFMAKVSTGGNVIWQKALESNNSNTGNYTNIGLDENKNIYMYYSVKDKVRFNGTEYSFNATEGNKILLKLNTNGNRIYHIVADKWLYSNSLIDVIGNDKINVTGFTMENNLLNYKINNENATNLYLATFGILDQKYLTPMQDYSVLTTTAISNNTGNQNQLEFELVNNVNWTAISDQNWLNLSFVKLVQGKSGFNTISGNGDAKITLVAETNNTGNNRSANILISGDNSVATRTVAVTQTGILGSQESKLFVTVLYPNPTSDILNIQTEQKISRVEIYDTAGKLVKTKSGNEKKIGISQLINGLYFIKIYSDGAVIDSKFIKN